MDSRDLEIEYLRNILRQQAEVIKNLKKRLDDKQILKDDADHALKIGDANGSRVSSSSSIG